MKNNKNLHLILVGLIVLISLGTIVRIVMPNSRFGFAGDGSEFPDLTTGTYVVRDIDLPAGEYAIYAVSSKGVACVDDTEYVLDHSDVAEIEDTATGIFSTMKASMIYGASPKVTVDEASVIVVQGDADFTMSFIKY